MSVSTVIFSVVGFLGLMLVGVMLLPQNVHVERQARISAQAAKVIELAASNIGYQQFNPYKNTDADLKINHFGPDTGVGSGFHFEGKEGKGSQTVAAVSANQVRYNIDLGDMGKPVQTISVQQVGEDALVTWTMDADLGMNPIARIFGLFMDGRVGPVLERGLDNLDAVA